MTNKNNKGKSIAKTNNEVDTFQITKPGGKIYLFTWAVLLVGFSITLFAYGKTVQSENTRARDAFEAKALGDISNAVVNRFVRDLSALEDIEAIFSASEFVTREEFRLFTAHELNENNGIQALEWIPYVRHDEREDFEAAARADGFLAFTLTERINQGEMIPRGKQDTYFPVYYVEPLEGNESALGFDLASNPARLEALNLARDTGEMIATSPIKLVQEEGQQSGVIIFYPIFKSGIPIDTVEQRRANLQGFALGVFRINDLIESALIGLSPEEIFLRVYDVDPTAGDILIYDQMPSLEHEESPSIYIVSKSINLAGRTYKLEFHSGEGFAETFRTSSPIVILVSGILMTTLLAYYIFSTEKQSIKLRLQEARVRNILDNAPDAMVVFTLEGLIVQINQQAERLFGYSRSELLGLDYENLFERKAGDLFMRVDFDAESSEDTNYDVIGLHKEGNEIPVTVKINPIELEGERLISSSIRDMSEFREAQRALVDSEEKYRTIFEHSSDIIQSVDSTGRFLFVNQVWTQTLGYREDELDTISLWDIIHPDSISHCQNIFSQAINGGTIKGFEASFITKNNKKILVEGNISPRTEGDQVVATHVFCRDITERRLIQDEIKRVADELTQLIDTANALIVTFDAEGRITEWNRACFETIGFTKKEMLGKTMPHLFPEEIRSDQAKTIRSVQNGKNLVGKELIIITKGGDEIVLSINATPRYDESYKLIGVVAIGQDITELDEYRSNLEKLVEEQTVKLSSALVDVQKADQLKSEFLSTAAHELRTPLTSIQGFSELLLTRKLNKEHQTRYLQMINDQSTNLGKIINDLLDLSRLEAGRGLEISKEPIDIVSLTEEIVSGLVEISLLHTFKIIKPKDPISVIGDPNRLMQVAQNLLSNAIKYSPKGGEVLTTYEISEDYLIISVSDQGIGMKPSQLEHLFEKFYRGDASNTSIGGTGLGLAITKSIVELHDGKIWVESEYNKGTTVFIRLPLAKETNSEDHK